MKKTILILAVCICMASQLVCAGVKADVFKEYRATINGKIQKEPFGQGYNVFIVDFKTNKKYLLNPDVIGADSKYKEGQSVKIKGIIVIENEGDTPILNYKAK